MNVERKKHFSKKRLKYARDVRGVSLANIADGTGISLETLRYCVKREKILPENLDLICKYLDVSQLYINEERTEKAPDPDNMETYPEYYSGLIDDDDLPAVISDIKRRIDPDGNWIPHYREKDIAEYLSAKQDEKEVIITLLVSNFSAPGSQFHRFSIDQYNRDYFAKHYEEIKERIEDLITGYILRHED